MAVYNSDGLDIDEKGLTGDKLPPIDHATLQIISDVANSYIGESFVYGNQNYVAMKPTFFEVDNQSVANKVMDCSSFVHALIMGIPFSFSRYCGRTDLAIGSAGYGMNMLGKEVTSANGKFNIREANQIAKWCYENGFAFYPSEDLSNIKAGDILFYKPDKPTSADLERFMVITHTDMCMGNFSNDSGGSTASGTRSLRFITTVGCDNIAESNEKIRTWNKSYATAKQQLVLCARLPLSTTIKNPKKPLGSVTQGNKYTMTATFSSALNPYKLYTIISEATFTEANHCLTYQVNGASTSATGTHVNGQLNVKKKYRWITSFLHDDFTGDVNSLNVSIGNRNNSTTCQVDSLKVYEGFYTDEEVDGAFAIVSVTGNTGSVAKDGYVTTGTKALPNVVPPSGYKPIGIVGFWSDNSYIVLTRCRLQNGEFGSTIIDYTARNYGTGALSSNITVDVLCAKY